MTTNRTPRQVWFAVSVLVRGTRATLLSVASHMLTLTLCKGGPDESS